MMLVLQSSEAIFDSIRKRIIELEFPPGSMLNEKDLKEEFGVSRTPIRESLIKLAQIGLVETRPRVGTFVTQIDLQQVKNAYEVKKNLEGLAAELAAKRATEKEIEELFLIIERFSSYHIVEDYKLCIQDDQRFHRIARLCSRNETLIEILDMLNTRTARFLQYIRYVITDYDWFRRSLRDIAEAIRNRNPEAARLHTEAHTKEFLDQMSQRFFG